MIQLDGIRAQIEAGDLAEAIRALREALGDSPGDRRTEVIALAGRFAELRTRERNGTLSADDASVRRNRLRSAVLELLDEIEGDPAKANTHVFVSYRREHGAQTARAIRLALDGHGVGGFLDVDDLPGGRFGPALLSEIGRADALVAVLSPGSLDPRDGEDWMRRELEHALVLGKRIVLILMPGFAMPSDLPPGLEELPDQNGVKYSHDFFDATITRLVELIRSD